MRTLRRPLRTSWLIVGIRGGWNLRTGNRRKGEDATLRRRLGKNFLAKSSANHENRSKNGFASSSAHRLKRWREELRKGVRKFTFHEENSSLISSKKYFAARIKYAPRPTASHSFPRHEENCCSILFSRGIDQFFLHATRWRQEWVVMVVHLIIRLLPSAAEPNLELKSIKRV